MAGLDGRHRCIISKVPATQRAGALVACLLEWKWGRLAHGREDTWLSLSGCSSFRPAMQLVEAFGLAENVVEKTLT